MKEPTEAMHQVLHQLAAFGGRLEIHHRGSDCVMITHPQQTVPVKWLTVQGLIDRGLAYLRAYPRKDGSRAQYLLRTKEGRKLKYASPEPPPTGRRYRQKR